MQTHKVEENEPSAEAEQAHRQQQRLPVSMMSEPKQHELHFATDRHPKTHGENHKQYNDLYSHYSTRGA